MNICLICRYEQLCPAHFEFSDASLCSSVKRVKCDGGSPKCSLCETLDIECKYGHIPYQEKTLKRGDACIPCYRKKKRCDAGKPSCSTCKSLRKSKECVYRNSESSNTSQTLQKVASFVSSSRNRSQGSNLDSAGALSDALAPHSHIQTSSETAYERVLEFNGDRVSESPSSRNASNFRTSSSPAQTRKSSDQNTDSTISMGFEMTSSFDHINTPDRQSSWPDFTSSISPPLSESLDVLNYNFRLTYVAHRYQFGTYMSFMKQQTILLGDRSNTFLHPFFVNFAELFGCRLFQEHRRNISLQDLETKYLELTCASMKTIHDDPYALAGAFLFLSKMCYYTRALHLVNHYQQIVKDILSKYNVRFLPELDGDHVVEISEWEHSKASFVAELVYNDYALRYVFEGQEDLFCDLEQRFRFEYPKAYPMLFQNCPFILRAVSILRLKDVHNLISLHRDQGEPLVTWLPACDNLASCLVAQAAMFSSLISCCVDVGDHELYDACSSASSSSPDIQLTYTTHFRGVIGEILETTAGLDPIDFHFLNPLVGICWSRITSLLMQDTLYHQDSGYPVHDYVEKLLQANRQLEASIRLMPSSYAL